MNSKEIAMCYISKRVKDPKEIFENEILFNYTIFWARESAKEILNTKNDKRFLVNYIDDIGSIIDTYLNIRRYKMFNKKFNKDNKYTSEEIISFIICRWLNVFYNLTSNPKYREFIDLSKIRELYEESITDCELQRVEDNIELEKINKLDKQIIKIALKRVWEDSISDIDFDFEDFKYLCEKYKFQISEILDHSKYPTNKISRENINKILFSLFLFLIVKGYYNALFNSRN